MVEEVKRQLEPGLRAYRYYRSFELFEELRIGTNLQEDYKKPEAQIIKAELKEQIRSSCRSERRMEFARRTSVPKKAHHHHPQT